MRSCFSFRSPIQIIKTTRKYAKVLNIYSRNQSNRANRWSIMATESKKIDELTDSISNLGLGKLRSTTSKKTEDTIEPWQRCNLGTGLVFDDFMAKHECLWTKSDECPDRYRCVKSKFEEYNLIEKCVLLEPQKATREQVLLVHDEDYYNLVKSTQGEKDIEKLKSVSEKFDGVYFNEHTYDIAMLALGSTLKLTNEVLDQQKIKNGFALIRTPGHHAQKSEANGFCFFNNAAIAAKHCVMNRNLKRVLVIDWDVHHGQGTQSFFYDDPNVLYVSIHRYEKGKFWPELIESNFNFTGQGAGKGFNINIPLNQTGCNDADFLLIWFNVILPLAYEYNPEVVIISAGFDAAIGCPEGKMRVKPITYHILCQSLMSMANGKVVALLEGGYNLLSLAEGAAMTLRALLNYPCPRINTDIIELSLNKSVIHTILSVIWAIRPQWYFLRLQGSFDRFQPELTTVTSGDVDRRIKFCPISDFEGEINQGKREKYDLEGVCCIKDEVERSALNEEINMIIQKTDLSTPKNAFAKRTLLVLNDEMTKHQTTSHPEKPGRYTSIKNYLNKTGLYSRCSVDEKGRKASEDEIALVHSKSHIDLIKSSEKMSPREQYKLASSMDSIYFNSSTYHCSLLAAGCAIEAVDKVLDGTYSNAFALIRPPGHHASADTAAGFCFFNNVVVAAKFAQKKYPDTCKRVLIIDYDFHHGNGVQNLVEDDPSILYISLHGYEYANEYPMEPMSNYNTGSKNIINIPWNDDIMSDSEYILAYLNIVLPAAYEFNPDLVLVSSGFDASVNDPIGKYKVSPKAYGHFIHHLLPLASGKLVACLEGGYNLQSISESAAHVVSVLLGDPPQQLTLKPPVEPAILSIKNVISYHKSNYNLLCFDYDLPSDTVE